MHFSCVYVFYVFMYVCIYVCIIICMYAFRKLVFQTSRNHSSFPALCRCIGRVAEANECDRPEAGFLAVAGSYLLLWTKLHKICQVVLVHLGDMVILETEHLEKSVLSF